MAHVLILGATSDMARAVAREYARKGYDLYLAAREPDRVGELATELAAQHGVEARTLPFDARSVAGHEAFFAALDPVPAGVVCLVGTMGRGPAPPEDMEDLREVVETNFLGPAGILEVAAQAWLGQRGDAGGARETSDKAGSRGTSDTRAAGSVSAETSRPFIVGVSSVAGDRGRQSNYPYGSAKAGFTAYLSGLRQRLHAQGIGVLTVKPGFVRTRMTAHLDLPPLVTGEPEEVARALVRAQEKGRNVIYVRGIWRPIMALIRLIPEVVFKRLGL